jgi:hypothetical protein
MQIRLNSRTLVGPIHEAAVDFVSNVYGLPTSAIDWVESPSAKCVLDLSPHDLGEELRLEQALRSHLLLPAFTGDDASASEREPQPRASNR